jgi:multiple sugar transport system substrate-binding protein
MERFRSAANSLTRRQVLALFGLGAVSAVVAACSSAPAPSPTAAPAAAPAAPAPPTATTAPAPPTPTQAPAAPTPTAAPAAAPTAAPTPTTAPAAAAAPASGGVVEILYGIHDDPAARKETLDAFNQANSGKIHVTIQMIQDFPTKIPTMAAAGTLPDVVRMWEAMVLDMARAGQVIPLDDKIKSQTDFNPDDFFKVFWDYPVVDGKRYAVADVGAPHFNFYNKDLFASAGVPEPKPDAAWTWDDYVSYATKISKPNQKIWGSDTIPVGWQYWTLKLVWQAGGDWYNQDYTKCTFDSPESIDTVQYWADILLKGAIMPTPEQAQATANGQGGGFFETAHVGLERWGIWEAANLIKLKFKWNFVPEPQKTQRATILHTGFNTVTKTSKNPDPAWQWLNAQTSTDGLYNYAHHAAFLSPRKSANAKKPWVLDGAPDQNWDIIPASGDYGRVLPGPHNETQALKLQGDALQAVYLGKAKAKDIFKDVATQVNDLIKLS